uniref:ORF5a protein n=1 Tax=Free State vervet virus TaxID=1737586 RepID=A0A159D7H5_9NIDO|nr:ORF5a protein [Free State vervet virus]
MFTELGLLVDLWLYHVVCIFALLCLAYAAHSIIQRQRQRYLAFLQSKRVHFGVAEDTHQ